jgi:hypothetical protein
MDKYIVGKPYWAQSEFITTKPEIQEIPLLSESIESTESIEFIESINESEPFYIKGIINGLGATISLWIFWTPFIMFIARPLINAQVKGFVCEGLTSLASSYGYGVISTWNNALSHYLNSLVQTGKIDEHQYYQLMSEYRMDYDVLNNFTLPPEIQTLLDENPQKNWNDNIPLFIIFAITFACVIIFCFGIIVTLCKIYNIDSQEILKFNLVMTFIVVCVESAFFGLVTMKYNPYDLNLIVKELESNVLNMFQ